MPRVGMTPRGSGRPGFGLHGFALLLVLCLTLGAVAVAYSPKAAQAPFAEEPPLTPTPQVECGPGSRPETGIHQPQSARRSTLTIRRIRP